MQRVDPCCRIELELVDPDAGPGSAPDAAGSSSDALQAYVDAPFDLERGPLFRARLLRASPAEHLLVCVVHHIVSDGWSLGVIARDLGRAYVRATGDEALADAATGDGPSPAEALSGWFDAQRAHVEGPRAKEDLRAWVERLSGLPDASLRPDRPRHASAARCGARRPFGVPEALGGRIRACARELGATPFALLLAAFGVLVGDRSGVRDVAVGVPVALRDAAGADRVVGMLLNTLAIRCVHDPREAFAQVLRRTWANLLEAQSLRHVPFSSVVAALPRRRRDPSRTPLVDTSFSLRPGPPPTLQLPGIVAESIALAGSGSAFDLTFGLSEAGEGWHGEVEYRADLFDASTIDALIRRYLAMLAGAAAHPDATIGAILRVAQAESVGDAAGRVALRTAERGIPFDRAELGTSLPARFGRMVRAYPDAEAVSCGGSSLSYEALDRAANAAAHRLLGRAAAGGRPVALLMDTGLPLVVWILAILKADLAYVPLDARLPDAVLGRMLGALGPRALVVATRHRERLRALPVDGLAVLDAEPADPGAPPSPADPAIEVSPDAPAYVFFTSGSTGAPKGVVDSHRNVLHNVMRYTATLGFGPGDRMSVVQSPSFSGTVSSLFGALLNGATAVLFDARAPDAPPLGEWVRRERISVFHGVPSLFRQLDPGPDGYPALRLVRVEGDRADATDIAAFRRRFRPGTVLVNGLGATECGLVRQYFVVAGGEAPFALPSAGPCPIGYPVPDVDVRVVDDAGDELPDGSIGEIVVESPFLALGYWNDPEATRHRFVEPVPGRRRYLTGDLGRMHVGGCLVHLGRRDLQPKVAGQFVDVGEVERRLHGFEGVEAAVAHVMPGAGGEQRVVAYVVLRPGAGAPSVAQVRRRLADEIPEAALPTAVVTLDGVPLTADGKVDRRALPAPARSRPALPRPATTPIGEDELAMARAWSEMLEIDGVGVDDPFVELGGDSVAAARLVARLVASDRPGWRLARVQDVFEHPTVRALARALAGRGGHAPEPIAAAPGPVRGDRPEAEGPGAWPAHAIAIVGVALQVPGASDPDTFWRNLRDGRDTIARWDPGPGAGADGPRVGAKGLIDDPEGFDAQFFGLTPRVAATLDPQQRVWLTCAYHALEDAGLDRGRVAGSRTGVFAGGRESTYLWDRVAGDPGAVARLLAQEDETHRLLRLGNDTDSLAMRTAWLLDLHGPAISVQTACSTSLVAVAQACAALVDGACDAAVAGGVTVTFPRRAPYVATRGDIRSAEGVCRPFDRDASGTVFGEGSGAVVLKRLADAVRDGDRVRAVIRGWSVNNDGGGKASYSAPSAAGQAAVIRAALAHAAVSPGAVGYVEAHGTATRVGDPIEVEGLARAFREGTDAVGYCALGSVKSNVGHLDSAAGIVGLAKAVLMLEHRQIPASLHVAAPNPDIDFASTPFRVADALRAWDAPPGSRIAGVSSFGVGGTNCHVVLQEFVPPSPSNDVRDDGLPHAMVLSAPDEDGLRRVARRWRAWLETEPAQGWPAIAEAALRGRGGLAHRLHVVARGAREAAHELAAFAERRDGPPRDAATPGGCWIGTARAPPPRIAFVFTGQGVRLAGAGRRLGEAFPAFGESIGRLDRLLPRRPGRSVSDLLGDCRHPGNGPEPTDFAQPLLFAYQWSVVRLLEAFGIRPDAVLGHSAGEIAAACVAGVFEPAAALRFAAARGELMHGTDAAGGMLAVFADAARVREMLDSAEERLSIAALNGPGNTVVSGAEPALDAFVQRLAARGVRSARLGAARAFHSPLMAPILPAIHDAASAARPRAATATLISGYLGAADAGAAGDPSYWVAHAREPVRFAEAVEVARAAGCEVFVEIGPQSVLAPIVASVLDDPTVPVLAIARDGDADADSVLRALARLASAGSRVDWRAGVGGRALRHVDLPGYPFLREPHR